ncbi:MAG: hypothetical protein AAFP69_23560 [Planctomycetota bacterium]
MNPGISVSRVGGAAQTKAMKKVSGGLRLDLAAYRELEAFAQMGTELDPATQAKLDRGERMVELLKQAQFEPMSATDQVLSLFAGTRGHMDDVPVNAVQKWEKDFLAFVATKHSVLRSELDEKQELTDEIVKKIVAAIDDFKSGYKPG